MQAKIDPPLPWRLTYVCQTHLFPPPQPKTYAGSSMSCTHCLAHTCTSGALGAASLLSFGPGGSLSSSAACFRARRLAFDPGNQDASTLRLRPTCFAEEKQCVGGRGGWKSVDVIASKSDKRRHVQTEGSWNFGMFVVQNTDQRPQLTIYFLYLSVPIFLPT